MKSATAVVVLLGATVAALAVGVTPAVTSEHAGRACGSGRWAVKTLQDPAGRALDLSVAKKTTVQALRGEDARRGSTGARGRGVESTVYEVRARLVSATFQKDYNIAVVIKGLRTAGTMIVELPTVSCSGGATFPAKFRMGAARDAFVAACGFRYTPKTIGLDGEATITGVGFFTVSDGRAGAAPNGVELAPALKFASATCVGERTAPLP